VRGSDEPQKHENKQEKIPFLDPKTCSLSYDFILKNNKVVVKKVEKKFVKMRVLCRTLF
jgi:hypothetical protein